MIRAARLLSALFLLSIAPAVCAADTPPAYGSELQGFAYPWPVARRRFISQGVALEMAYIDVEPAHPTGHVAVLLHGKNFCAATWQDTINVLTNAGYRVIAPDQIGFCKSTKPMHYQYTFQQLAGNTHDLLAGLGIEKAVVIGHSTGGMLGIRYALMYPDAVEQLVLVDPIGLEDWKAKGVPWISVDQWFAREERTTEESLRNYERGTYYAGTWAPAYEKWVQMLAGMYRGPDRDIVAWNSALLDDMIYSQPVVYEFSDLKAPVLLMIGDKDTTALGKDFASPELRAKLGDYPALAKAAASRIPRIRLVEFPDCGHTPQIQAPNEFHRALLDGLAHPAP